MGAIQLTNRKAIGLLAYLLIELDHEHSREFLLGLLWPDLPAPAAQNNLRVTWAYLRKALGVSDSGAQPALTGSRLALRFNPLSDHELDVARFNTLIETCRQHPHLDPQDCAECAARLAQALELVRGDFLEEFSLGDCDQFDDWLLIQREHYRLQVTSALEQLAAYHERAGQLAEAESAIRRLLEYDPLSESAYRQLMRVLAGADQRSAALDAYETCRRVLATELGLAPAVETVRLAEQIRGLASLEFTFGACRFAALADALFRAPAGIGAPGGPAFAPDGPAGDIVRTGRRRQDTPGHRGRPAHGRRFRPGYLLCRIGRCCR